MHQADIKASIVSFLAKIEAFTDELKLDVVNGDVPSLLRGASEIREAATMLTAYTLMLDDPIIQPAEA